MKQTSHQGLTSLSVLVIIGLGLLAYANTWHAPFVFDDRLVIEDNTIIKDLDFFLHPAKAQAVSGHFEYQSFKSRFLGHLSFALNYAVHGLDVTGYHLVNFALHLLNGLLVYQLVVLTFLTPYFTAPPARREAMAIALVVSLLFVCHPVQTGAVTYVWQRVTLLATTGYCLSLTLYVRWRLRGAAGEAPWRPRNILLYGLALLSSAAAMQCKQIAFTLPVMLLVYEGLFFSGDRKRRLLALLPFLLTMAIIPLVLLELNVPLADLDSSPDSGGLAPQGIARPHYLFTQFRVLITYLRLLVWPVNQVLDYDYPIYTSIWQLPVLLSGLALSGLLALAVYCLWLSALARHRHGALRLVGLGILWFFITISIESSVIPIFDVIFEHRLYLPSIGLFIAVVTAVFHAIKQRADQGKALLPVALAAGVLAALVLTFAAHERNKVWASPITLWQDVTQKSPNKARGFYQLGTTYGEAQDYPNALLALEVADRLAPNSSQTLNNLGNCNYALGRLPQAESYWLRALANDAKNAMAAYNLAMLAKQRGDEAKADGYYQLYLRNQNQESLR